jgi:Domain of unknown function (DUF4280)
MGAGQKFVPNGVMLMCNGGVAPGRLNVIPKNVMLDGQIFATELDTMPFVNIPSFGACQRLRYCPPCMPAPTGWKDVCDDGVKVMGARPLLEKSTNSCAIGGKITIMFVPPGGFSGSFTGITPSGLPDMSALTGGDGLSSLASNPAAAISNVGGVASLANVGSGGLTSITNLGSNGLSSAAGGVNALRQAASKQTSGMFGNFVGNIAGGLSNITNRLGEIVAPMQKTLEQGAQLMDNLQKGANRINELGGVLSHKSLQDAAQKWAAQLQKNHGYLDSIAKASKYLQEGAIASSDFFKKFKALSDKNQLGAKWDTFIEKLGTGAKNFFNHFQKVPKQYDTVGEWLQMAKTGVKKVASEAAAVAKDLSGTTKYLEASSVRIKTFGGVMSAITRNPAAQEAANKWATQLDIAAKNTENIRYKIQILPTLVDYAKESSAFFEKYIQQQPSGNPFQNWGNNVSSWIQQLKNQPIDPPRAGSVKELLGNLSKITDNLEHGFEKGKLDFGRKTVHLNNLSGVLSLIDKNAASKMQDWSNKTQQLEQEANKIAEQAKSWKKRIESAQNAKKHWNQAMTDAKKDLEKAKAYWNKMKEKLPNFSKGADLLQQSLPNLPEVASIAAISKAFPAMDSIVNASQVANLPIANAFSSSITNSFNNNTITNDSTSSVTQTGAVKGGSVSVSASGGGGMGVVNGNSRIGTVTVQKGSVSLPDMSDEKFNEPKKQLQKPVIQRPIKYF